MRKRNSSLLPFLFRLYNKRITHIIACLHLCHEISMKKEQFSASAPLEHHLQHFTDEHPLMQWIERHGKTLLAAFLGVIVLLFAVYRVSSNSTAKAEADYFEAAKQFALFQKGDDKEAFAKLQATLAHRPELHPKYDGQIAQTLLNRGDAQAAEEYASLVFARVRNDQVPYYEEFASITLLISQGDYPNALKRSQELKQKLLKDATASGQARAFGDTLFAYNLLRVALLEQKAGTPQGEKAAWDEWNTYSQASTNSASIRAASFYTLDSLFGEGPLTLNSYIKSREKALQ